MKTRLTSAKLGTIFNIVVNQEPILEEFEGSSSVNGAFGISTERFTHEHAEGRTQPFRGAARVI
jgi:hypothetical protein